MSAITDPAVAATFLAETIARENKGRLVKISNYRNGKIPDPYSPDETSGEHKSMMERAKQPWVAIPGKAVSQTMAVEGYITTIDDADDADGAKLTDSPEWQIWQRSNLDYRQSVIHRATADYGQAFVLSEIGKDGKAYVRLLPTRYTAMLFDDVLSDDNAAWAYAVLKEPKTVDGKTEDGQALLWDQENRYEVTIGEEQKLTIGQGTSHGGNGHNPVTRFVGLIDDDGKVTGEVEPLMAWQDMFTQVLFNLLSTQTDSAFRTIWGSGLAPEYLMNEKTGQPILNKQGQPIRIPVQLKPAAMVTAENHDARFGVLAGSEQNGYIQAADMLVKQFTALSQTPPNFTLGSMANMSAEALDAVERSFRRKVAYYQRACGEAWERAIRICRVMEGAEETEALEHGEVVWTDFDKYQLIGMADALGKLAQMLDVPKRGLWPMIPGVSPAQLEEWARLADEQDELARLSSYADVQWDDMGEQGEIETEPDLDVVSA